MSCYKPNNDFLSCMDQNQCNINPNLLTFDVNSACLRNPCNPCGDQSNPTQIVEFSNTFTVSIVYDEINNVFVSEILGINNVETNISNSISSVMNINIPDSLITVNPYIVKKKGVITNFKASFTVTIPPNSELINSASTLYLNAVLFIAPNGSDTYTSVPESLINLASWSDTPVTISVNTVYPGILKSINVNVNKGDRVAVGYGLYFTPLDTSAPTGIIEITGTGDSYINFV